MDIYLCKENAIEFFEKIVLDNEPDNLNFTNKRKSKFSHPVDNRKSPGYRRTIAKNRFRGQRDGAYSEHHAYKAFNCYCKKISSESCSSIITRGYNDYIEEIEDETKSAEFEKAKKIAKAQYEAALIEERVETLITLISCAKRINEIEAELEKLASE